MSRPSREIIFDHRRSERVSADCAQGRGSASPLGCNWWDVRGRRTSRSGLALSTVTPSTAVMTVTPRATHRDLGARCQVAQGVRGGLCEGRLKRTANKESKRTTRCVSFAAGRRSDTANLALMNHATRIAVTPLAALLASAALCSAAGADNGVSSACTVMPPPADPALPAAAPAVVTYPTPSSTGVTKRAATLRASVDTNGIAGQVAFELGDAEGSLRCTASRPLAAVTGPQAVTAQLRSETPARPSTSGPSSRPPAARSSVPTRYSRPSRRSSESRRGRRCSTFASDT